MAKEFVNRSDFCPFRVEIYDGEKVPTTLQSSLESLLNDTEARSVHLSREAYKAEIRELCGHNSGETLTALAYEKENVQPAGIVILEKRGYDSQLLVPIPGHEIAAEIKNTARKSLWELKYCVRRADLKGKAVGDICMGCAIEGVIQSQTSRRSLPRNTNIWLKVAGSFKNTAAIRLYLTYNFIFAGFYQDERSAGHASLVMVLPNVNEAEKVEKSFRSLRARLQALYLLPSLLETPASADPSRTASVEPDQPSLSVDHTPGSSGDGTLQDDQGSLNDSNDQAGTDQTHRARKRRRRRGVAVAASPRPAVAGVRRLINGLKFRNYLEQLRYSATIIEAQKDISAEDMIQRSQLMLENINNCEQSHALLQNLEIARQLEYISRERDEHVLNTASSLDRQGQLPFSLAYAREVLKAAWAIYRYPVLRQVKLTWTNAVRALPEIAEFLDEEVKLNKALPDTIRMAQDEQYQFSLRLSIQFPEACLGDGDGLPGTRVNRNHGFYQDDNAIDDIHTVQLLWKPYVKYFGEYDSQVLAGRSLLRSRLVGFDTQEAPRPPGRRDAKVPQPFWREGKETLERELERLRGDIPIPSANILVDCYGVDVFGRLLVDIRGINRSNNEANPTTERFDLAKRVLLSGYAYPTTQYFTNDTLLNAFQESVREKRGCFKGDRPTAHPIICRRDRHQLEISTSRARRHMYSE